MPQYEKHIFQILVQIFNKDTYLAFLSSFPVSLFLCKTNGNLLETTIMLPEDAMTSTTIFPKLIFLPNKHQKSQHCMCKLYNTKL